MRYLLTLIILLLLNAFGLAQADGACNGFTPRLSVGDVGQVTPGDANNVRAAPSSSAELVGQLSGGERFTVLGSPVCADGFTWWEVVSEDTSVTGWTVAGTPDEYWIEPRTWLGYTSEQVAFDFTPIANRVDIELVPANPDSYEFWLGAPDYIRVTLEDLIVSEYITPRVHVIPIAFFEGDDPDVYNGLTRYHASLYSDNPDPQTITYLPWINAARVHFSHLDYIETDTVRGYRFVTMFAQYPAPIRSYEMFYMFTGTTPDGRHMVSAWLPISAPSQDIYLNELAESEDIFNDNGVKSEYREMLGEYAINLPSEAFYPSLATLDGVVESIQLGEGVEMPPALGARPYEQPIIQPPDVVTNMFGGGDVGLYTFYYDLLIDDITYMNIIGMSEQDLYTTDYYRYQGWQTFAAALDGQTPPAEYEQDALGFALDYEIIGAVRFIETDAIRGVRFVTASGRGAMVGPPLSYRFWGITPNNTVMMVSSTLDVGTLPETAGPSEILTSVNAERLTAAFAERDAVIETMTFATSQIE